MKFKTEKIGKKLMNPKVRSLKTSIKLINLQPEWSKNREEEIPIPEMEREASLQILEFKE
jgi:hypothetical protein